MRSYRNIVIILIVSVLAGACGKTETPTPIKPPLPEVTKAPSTVAAEPTDEIPTVESLAESTATPGAAHAWPTPIAAEEELSRNPVSEAERATFEQLAQAVFVVNDPLTLASAIKGVPGPINPLVATDTPMLDEGTVQTFWVLNHDTQEWNQIEARLERVTEHAYLWFDKSRELVDKSVYDKAAEAFETMYEPDREVYGTEWNPGIDGDSHVYVLHVNAKALCNVTEATAHQCGLLGYFSSLDELPAIVEPHSNQHEMFVMNMDMGGIGGEKYLLTLTHEFRHMIEFNYDRHDDDWEVEGTAMMAEDLLGFAETPIQYANLYLETGTDLQMNTWSVENSLPHYGKGYAFARYIYHRLGKELYSAWVQHPDRGFFALDTVLAETGNSLTARDLWLDFATAVSLLGIENVPEEYSFGEGFQVEIPGKVAVNSFPKQVEEEIRQYAFDVLNIRSNRPVKVGFTGTTKTLVLENRLPASGSHFWWSGRANQSDVSLTRVVDLSGVEKATLQYSINYKLERGYDFAYVFISLDDGKTWQALISENMQGDKLEDNPADLALTERFYTGVGKGWVEEKVDLTPYAGKRLLLRFQYITDAVFTASGIALDNVSIPEIGFYDDIETGEEGWEAQGFSRVTAYMPQRFDLVLITFDADGMPLVQHLEVADDNSTAFEIALAEDSDQALLLVAASNPMILTPASYSLRFER
ncbi:MAG TPA: hypothetical protein VI755_01165 [Anaerolineales bacterium]|nr:hypothetical protein [Anaerolineales bacterium]